MYSTWLSFLLINLLINITSTDTLRCHEDINGSVQLIDNCRACVIFIDTKLPIVVSPRKTNVHGTSSIEELFFYNEKNHHRRHRRDDANIIIRQKCAREYDGPLYGYDRTHCYCNSHRCNSNIQRCIYEIASKRYFSCYHGSNSSQHSLNISKKCRSCRIRVDADLIHHYECLTFGEQEQNNRTHCTCQYPMCNQDLGICQRFQQRPSQPRVNAIEEVSPNNTTSISTSTIMTTTTTTTSMTSLITNSTNLSTTVSSTNRTEEIINTENCTLRHITSLPSNETQHVKTIIIEIKNHVDCLSFNFYCISSIVSFLLIVCDY